MFWERSDSKLSDEQLKGLKNINISCGEMSKAISPFFDNHFLYNENPKCGTFNHVFYVENEKTTQSYAARFNIYPNISNQSFHLEQWINNEAISRGFPTPRIVHVDTSSEYSEYPFQLIEWSDGEWLRGFDEITTRNVLYQLGRELKKLHNKPIYNKYDSLYGRISLGLSYNWDDFVTSNFESDINYLRDNNIISFEQKIDISDMLEQLRNSRGFDIGAPSLLHADLSYDNILVNSDTKDLEAIIDWGDAVIGDPIFELAGLATFHPIDRHSLFIESYYQREKKPKDFEYRFWIYYLRIALAKAVHRHRFGYTTEVKLGYQNPDNRIQLALNKLKEIS